MTESEATCPACLGKGRIRDYEAEGIVSAVPGKTRGLY